MYIIIYNNKNDCVGTSKWYTNKTNAIIVILNYIINIHVIIIENNPFEIDLLLYLLLLLYILQNQYLQVRELQKQIKK